MLAREEMQERFRELERRIASKKGVGAAYGLAKGLSVTLRTMMRRSITVQYPHVKPDLPPRTRGVIALKEENCTVCMLCSRECPDWCIYIDSHKEVMPPKTPGARARSRNVLDRFAIDYALCMYCGICVEVCPFDALFWSPHFEYSTVEIDELTHEMPTLARWMEYVPPPPPLETGADPEPEAAAEAKVYATVGAGPALAPAPAPAAAEAPAVPATEARAAEAPAAPPAPKAERHDEPPPEPDPETYQAMLAQGKSEREARALAKQAAVIKRRRQG